MAIVVLGSSLLLNPGSIVAVAGALALAAFQLGPAFQLVSESVARYRTDWIGSGGGLPWQSLVSLVWPNWYGIFDLDSFRQPLELTHLYVFCGWTGLGLAVWGSRREPRLAMLTVAFAAAMLGEYTPAGRSLFALLPQLVQCALDWYPFLAAFTLSLALLAGSAVRSHGLILSLALTVELILAGSGRPMNTQSLARDPGLAEADIRKVRAVAGDGRMDAIESSGQLWSSAAPLTRLPSANGYDPLALERLINVRLTMARGQRWGAYYPIETPRHDSLAVLGVSAVIAREPGGEYEGLIKAREAIPGYVLYRVGKPVARVRTVARVRPAPAPGFDPWQEAIVEGMAERGYGPADVDTLEFSRNHVRLQVNSAAGAFVVISDTFTRDWRALIDGAPTAIHPANQAMRGIAVPAGRHGVLVEIDRWRFWRWSLISVAAAVVLVLLEMRSGRWLHRTGRG